MSVVDITNENIINLKAKFVIDSSPSDKKPINTRFIIIPLIYLVQPLAWTIKLIIDLLLDKHKHTSIKLCFLQV